MFKKKREEKKKSPRKGKETMNDFLKSLRSNSREKRYDRNERNDRPNRRHYGNSNHGNTSYSGNPQYINPQYKNDRNNGNIRRYSKNPEDSRIVFLLEESLPDIKELISRLASAGERLAAAEERKASALEGLSESLGSLASGELVMAAPAGVPAIGQRGGEADVETDDVRKPVNDMARDAVLDIILSMRDDGATYGKIADYLDSENIPTFSRKGKWHAQTIHRICRECG
jgi:hypothetical protein